MPSTGDVNTPKNTPNSLTLSARVAELLPLRYTPAGLPALDVTLEHMSVQQEAGGERQAVLRLKAVAFGTQAERLGRQALESLWTFQGFLAQGRNGKGVVFHIQQFQPQ